jgi:hypothetical protein
VAARTDRLLGRTEAAPGLASDELLDDAVLQRVVAEDRQTANVAEKAAGLRKRGLQAEELLVDRDPKGLKRPGGGVGLASGPPAYGLLDGVG